MRRVVLWGAVLLYLAAIFFLSSQSNPLPALTSSVSDKILHGVEYGGLGALLTLALEAAGLPARRALVAALVAASLYGASDEIHQAFVPNRDCSPLDWVADSAGAALGAGLAVAVGRRKARSPG